MKKFLGYTFKIIIIFFIILTLVFAYLSIFNKWLILDWLAYIKWIIHSLWYWNYVIIFLFWFIESFPLIWVSVPWQMVLVVIAWFLWYEWILLSWICASLWALLWNYTWYLMWKVYWASFFEKYWNWIWVWQTEIKYIKKWMEKQWILWVVFWKFHNLLRAFVPFIAWSSNMNNITFMISNIIGSILRAWTMVFIWVFFVNNAQVILDNIWKIMLWIIFMFAIYIYLFKKEEFKKYWKEKNIEIEKITKNLENKVKN